MNRDMYKNGFNRSRKYSFKNLRKSIITSFTFSAFFALGLVVMINFFSTQREIIILISEHRTHGQ